LRSMLRNPRRASTSAADPNTADAQVAAVAWTIVTGSSCRAARNPAGGISNPTSAQSTEPRAASFRPRALLLRVGPSNRGRSARAADDAGHGDQGEHVGKGLEEHRPGRGLRDGEIGKPLG